MRSAAQSRLEDAYQKSEHEKTAALLKIKQLEDKLSKATKDDIRRAASKTIGNNNHNSIHHLLSIAETKGPEAALQWAKSVDHTTTGGANANANANAASPRSPFRPAAQMGFHTGMGVSHPMTTINTTTNTPRNTTMTMRTAESPLRRARIASRTLTPLRPNNTNTDHGGGGGAAATASVGSDDYEPPERTERRLLRSFREAAKYVPFEFSSDLATYTVRRPYGIPTKPKLFQHCERPSPEQGDTGAVYAKKAHVSDKTSMEVAAVSRADRKPFLLFGAAGIRYRTGTSSGNENTNTNTSDAANNDNNNENDWHHFENVDALDRPLGHVTYIDSAANEKEYSLDEILEEAMLVREQYCGTLTSTALGLDAQALPSSNDDARTGPSSSMAMSMSETTTSSTATLEPNPSKAKAPSKDVPEQQQQPPPPPQKEEAGGGSSDVLVVFVGMIASLFVKLVWGVVVGTPLRIIRTAVVLVAAGCILQALHLYLLDDYTTWALREMNGSASSFLEYGDLTYHSNRQPGIL